jgi:hypothetical protein
MYRESTLPMLYVICIVLSIYSVSSKANAQEYFGAFSGEPSFKVKTNAEGRPTFVLLEDFSFTDPNGFKWETSNGWEVVGASIPQLAWSFVGGPMSGKYIHASIIHDRYCDEKNRTAHDTHRNFYYGMLANGVPEAKAKVMYWAVRTFGPSWKVVKETFTQGVTSQKIFVPPTYLLQILPPPNIPEEKIKELLGQVESGMSITQLESLSDSIRKEYGAEKLQREQPKFSAAARIRQPSIRLPKLFP